MRDYIFRGFHPCEDGNETIYIDGKEIKGYWIRSRGAIKNRFFAKVVVPDKVTGVAEYVNVIPWTVSISTGKYDRNSKEIFEDDIVHELCNDLIAAVEWDDELGTFRLSGLGESYTIRDAHIDWEVLGDRFSTPKLLDGCNRGEKLV